MKLNMSTPIVATLGLILCFSLQGQASYLLPQTSQDSQKPSYLLAQNEGSDESYDPFSDYSEFDEASDEEADINFFRNGRFFTVGFVAGLRSFTDKLASLYSNAPTYGIYICYFFDLRFALQLGFNTGDHEFSLVTPTETLGGNVSLTFIHLNLKYYLNTQNVTRGLADLNPYFVGGFSQVYRTFTLNTSSDALGKDATTGLDIGTGIEIPLMRKKAYFGVQATYHYVNFRDENTFIPLSNGSLSTAQPKGDTYDLQGILGLNF